MNQVNDFCGAIFIRDADGSPARHYPDKILVPDLEPALIGQVNRKGLERGLLSRFSDLLRCHIRIITEFNSKVQPLQPLCQVFHPFGFTLVFS